MLFDELAESRLIAAMLAEPDVLEQACVVELDDLADFRHQAVLVAIRELQQHGGEISLLNVADAIAMRDVEHDSHIADTVHPAFLGCLLLDLPKYPSAGLVGVDIGWLRKLACRRRKL